LVGTLAVLNEFVRNPVLRDGVLRATLAIAVPDFVLSLSYTLFHFLNLLRGSKTTGVACEFFGVVTSCIVHATFCGPPIVAFSTYVMIRNSASGCTGDPKLSWTANACLVVLPWLLGFGFAMAALREGKLGDYRGLLCYNTQWDSFFTGGVTIAVFATATVATLVLYLAAVATIATTIKTARATYSYKDDTRLWLLLRAGLLLVGSFFASWILFVVAIIIPASGQVSTLTYEMIASLGISLQPIIHTAVLLQPISVRRSMFERLLAKLSRAGGPGATQQNSVSSASSAACERRPTWFNKSCDSSSNMASCAQMLGSGQISLSELNSPSRTRPREREHRGSSDASFHEQRPSCSGPSQYDLAMNRARSCSSPKRMVATASAAAPRLETCAEAAARAEDVMVREVAESSAALVAQVVLTEAHEEADAQKEPSSLSLASGKSPLDPAILHRTL